MTVAPPRTKLMLEMRGCQNTAGSKDTLSGVSRQDIWTWKKTEPPLYPELKGKSSQKEKLDLELTFSLFRVKNLFSFFPNPSMSSKIFTAKTALKTHPATSAPRKRILSTCMAGVIICKRIKQESFEEFKAWLEKLNESIRFYSYSGNIIVKDILKHFAQSGENHLNPIMKERRKLADLSELKRMDLL